MLEYRQNAYRLKTAKLRLPQDNDGIQHESTGIKRPCAVVVGVGRGFGFSLVEKLANEGFHVIAIARDSSRLEPLFKRLTDEGLSLSVFSADAADEIAMQAMFSRIHRQYGVPDLVVYSVQYFSPGRAMDIELPAFEEGWRNNCFGGFIAAREAGRLMTTQKQGSIILVGSTSSLHARADHLNLAVGKFGLRALTQVLSQELWPLGIHVAHLIIDAEIDEGVPGDLTRPKSNPDNIANAILFLHQQSSDCWTSEMDLRPSKEVFWQHC